MIAGAASCFHLAAGPLLAQDDRATPIESRDVKQVLADIDTDHGDSRIELLCHGVLVVFGACVYRKLDSAILMVRSTQYGP